MNFKMFKNMFCFVLIFKMQISFGKEGNANGKASGFGQLVKYHDNLLVTTAIMPSLAVSVS